MEELIQDYKNGLSLEEISKKYHFGKIKVKQILQENGVEIRKKGGQTIAKEYKVSDWRIEKYPPTEGYHYVAESKDGKYKTNDYMNNGGFLTTFIHDTYNIAIPSLYDRREYYMKNGDYWWEQWFNIYPIKNQDVKKCPYCDWETTDIDNKSGAFEKHLLVKHNITKEEYLKAHSEDEKYFECKTKFKQLQLSKNPNEYVECQVCHKKFSIITETHLKKHKIDKLKYIQLYGNKLTSDTYHKTLHDNMLKTNISISKTYESSDEIEIKEFIRSNGYDCFKDRKELHGEELDIFIPSFRVAIEYNGNYWHQECFGKTRYYHLDKLEKCNANGIKLLQIFEDEYKLHKEIVLSKIENMLNLTKNRLYARKCSVKEITYKEAKTFLNNNHIQGFAKSSVYIGAYYQDNLVGVMTFLHGDDNKWELNRFATLLHYNIVGLGSKLLKYFINNYHPKEIKSFADRRWTLDKDNNLYTNLGFELSSILPPDYRYYNSKIDRYKRFHKFGFRKNILHKKYGFSLEMTETQMVKELGFDKIFDCGLLKYVLKL